MWIRKECASLHDKDCEIIARLRLNNASEDLSSAEIEYEAGHLKAANNRAYYSIFHAIRSILALEKVDFKSHAQLLGYFNKNYIHAGLFPAQYGRILKDASKIRTDSDYNDFFIATQTETRKLIDDARLFYEVVGAYLSGVFSQAQ
jgi:uncharacterized protein (UPF0332 family)